MSVIYVRSRTGGNYRRAGFTWTGAWAKVDVGSLSKEQAEQIKADPHLTIRDKAPEEFAAPQIAPGFDAGEASRPADIKALEAQNADLRKELERARQGTHSVEAQVRASVAEAVAELDRVKAENADLRKELDSMRAAAAKPTEPSPPAPKADDAGKAKAPKA